MILDGAVDPNADPIEAEHPPGRRVPEGVQRLRRRLRHPTLGLPAGHRPAKAVDVYRSLVDPLVKKPAKTAAIRAG